MKPWIKGLLLFAIVVLPFCCYAALRKMPQTGETSRLPAWIENELHQLEDNEKKLRSEVDYLKQQLRAKKGAAQIPEPSLNAPNQSPGLIQQPPLGHQTINRYYNPNVDPVTGQRIINELEQERAEEAGHAHEVFM